MYYAASVSSPDGGRARFAEAYCIYNLVDAVVNRLANLDRHGLGFADLDETFFDNALVLRSYNSSKRWVAIGADIRGVIVVVFARLGREGVSIISMRPASKNERKLYAEH